MKILKKLIFASSIFTFLVACAGTPEVQTGEGAEVIADTNLHRVDNTRAKMAYMDPDVDFGKYQRVLVRPLGVDNIEVIQPSSSSSSAVGRGKWELTDADRQMLQDIYQEAMTKQLEERGQFPIVTEPADDVLVVSAMITALAPSGPKDDSGSRTAGRSRVITEGAGSIAVAVAFSDAETGEVLALVKDSRSSSSHWGSNNSVTNKADVRRVFNSWATQINNSLATLSGGE